MRPITPLLLVCAFLLMGCGKKLAPQLFPKVECRSQSDCTYPQKCIHDLCVAVPALPQISRVTPQESTEGAIMLHVIGKHFEKNATVFWDNKPLPTSYLSKSALTATVQSNLSEQPHEVSVRLQDGTTSRAYLLTLLRKVQVDRISFSQIAAKCGKETLVVWGRYFWKKVQAVVVSKDGKKKYPSQEIRFLPNGELHIVFDFSLIPKGAYELHVHNGDESQSHKQPFTVVDKLPEPQLLSWGPRQFWWGSQAQIYLVGINLHVLDLRFQQRAMRRFQLNQSTSYVAVDLNELSRTPGTNYFWLTARKLCQAGQKFYPVEVHPIPKPAVEKVTPEVLTFSYVDDVIVQGRGFHPDARLRINGREVVTAQRLNLEQFRVPRSEFAEAGTYSIQVRNPQYNWSTLRKVVVNHTPVVQSIRPGLLPRNREQKVEVEGNNFGPQVELWIDNKKVDNVERIDSTRLFVPGAAFPQTKKYQVTVVNPGEKPLRSNAFAFQVEEGPQIETLSSPLVLIGHSKGDIQIRGSDFDEKGKLLLNGKAVDSDYAQWVNTETWSLAVSLLDKEGEYKLQIRNLDQTVSNVVMLFVRKATAKLITSIKEVGELTYLCGSGLRGEASDETPRIQLFAMNGTQPVVELESSNSTFDPSCVYFNTKEIEYLPARTYLVKICQDAQDKTVCSHEYPWNWRGNRALEKARPLPPRIDWVRPVNPTTWVWPKEKQPKTHTVMLGGQNFRGTTSVWINGADVSQIKGVRLSILNNRIVLYQLPLPEPVYGDHVIEVRSQHGRSNTYFYHIAEQPSLRIIWTPSLFLPRDDDVNFRFYGSGLSRALQLFVDGALVKLGKVALPWSQFASVPPYFLSSFNWTTSQTIKPGLRSFRLQNAKTKTQSNSIVMLAGNDDQWGKEPLRLQASEDIYRYKNSAGLAPYVNQTTALRLAYTGFVVSATNPKQRGTVVVEGRARTYTTGRTTLFGYSQLNLRAMRFSGSPRVVPIYLKNPGSRPSNLQFLTVMPAGSYRLTKVYNASDFSAIVRPNRRVQLQVHGNFMSKADTFYFLGRPIQVDSFYRDPTTRDEFVRISLNAGDLPDGQYPLWAVSSRKNISNSLLVTVRRKGIAGAPRLRFVNPMVWSKASMAKVQYNLRLAISAIGITSDTRLILQGKSYPIQLADTELGYAQISVGELEPGTYSAYLENKVEKTQSIKFQLTVEP